MELDFNCISANLSKDYILSKISEYDIFTRYCRNFEEINVDFCSELRVDKRPGCRIFISNVNNTLLYRDFAEDLTLDCFRYVMEKFKCNYFDALKIIANDFGIMNIKITTDSKLLTSNDEIILNKPIINSRSYINIVSQAFNIYDFDYWNQYYIELELLQEYNVFSAKYVHLTTKSNKKYTFEYKKNNPCYAYKFIEEGEIYYKVYWPYSPEKKRKWLFNGKETNIEGYDQLNLNGDLLIITKSLKDVMVLRTLGYDAISLQGEVNKLHKDMYYKLSKRFDRIVSLYDNDEEGIKGANKLKINYNIKPMFIPYESGCKDISDYIKKYGIKDSKELMKRLLNE